MKHDLLRALELIKEGDWDGAHDIAKLSPDREGSWIHALLHRIEGDTGNAGYWYRRAGIDFPTLSVDEEWQQIYEHLSQSR